MAVCHVSFRAAASWLLVSLLSGAFPAAGADAPPTAPPDLAHSAVGFAMSQPAFLAFQDGTPQPGAQNPVPPSPAQEPTPQSVAARPPDETPATAAPAKHHLSKWVWLAVVAGIAAGAGTAIVLANHQPGKTSPPAPTVTVNVGGGSAGAP
jgi:hypothetical protein